MTHEHPDTGCDVQPGERGVGTEPDFVKLYSSDRGHRVGGAYAPGPCDRLASLELECRQCVAAHPWLAVGAMAALGMVFGALAARRCANHRSRGVRAAHSMEDPS